MKTKTKKHIAKNAAIGGGALLAAGVLVAGAMAAKKAMKQIPKGVEAVKPFDINKFLGKWYEIARLDYRFEKNMNNTTAEYSMNNDGTIKVMNRGYNFKKGKMQEAEGKAKFADAPNEGKLKVSFGGPIYSGYNVIEIDREYKYAMIAGQDMKHLWLLSRESSMPEDKIEEYLAIAESYGYDTSKLVWVGHDDFELYIEDVEVYM